MNRLDCLTPGCTRTILPVTAADTGGYCKPCANERASLFHHAYVAANRVDVDRFAGITDPVELLARLHCRPLHDELKNDLPCRETARELYGRLSQADLERLLARADADEDLLRLVVTHAAAYGFHDLEAVQDRLLRAPELHPPFAFRGAPQRIVDALLRRLADSPGGVLRDATLLEALAWTRHPAAIEQFIAWRRKPPLWADMHHVPVHDYTQAAGFEVEGGHVRELVSLRCFEFAPYDQEAAPADEPSIEICARPEDAADCPTCGLRATALFEFEAVHWGGPSVPDERVVIPTCLACTEIVVVRGRSRAGVPLLLTHDADDGLQPDNEAHELPARRVSLSRPRPPWETVEVDVTSQPSQLGGHPGFLQGSNYPRCPSCSRLMPFVAQLGLEDYIDYEGFFHAFWCRECGTTATSWDQT